MHQTHAPYSAQFRQQMVDLVATGRKPSELAAEFGCHITSILHWVRKVNMAGSPNVAQTAPLSADERAELITLRRKLRQVQQERDILAKATAWFAVKSEKTSIASINS